jgi:pimeloyl-ACP methyl ester carboxylesterase
MVDSTSGPTVVLVHGAFADAEGWAPVTERLIATDVPVTAIFNPLRGIASDAAYVASFINHIDGPVLAVGHSYGGAIITNAVSADHQRCRPRLCRRVRPRRGRNGRRDRRTLQRERSGRRGPGLPVPHRQRRVRHIAGCRSCRVPGRLQRRLAPTAVRRLRALPASRRRQRARRRHHQGAWKDPAADSDFVRSMAQRPYATITEIDGSHVIMISQPRHGQRRDPAGPQRRRRSLLAHGNLGDVRVRRGPSVSVR